MYPLLLSGYGVKVKVNDLDHSSELEVTNGREDERQTETMRFRPRHFPYSSVIIESQSGYISLQAFHWLAKNQVPVFMTHWDGSIISSLLPPMPIKADLRAAQFRAAANPEQKFDIAKALVAAKLDHGLRFLEWLGEKAEITHEVESFEKQLSSLNSAESVRQVRMIEAFGAKAYWKAYRKALPRSLDFLGRNKPTHIQKDSNPRDASDPVNATLNYGYGFLQGECLKAINEVGLEPSVAFLHEFHMTQIRNSLVFDFQEPFRWLVDFVVMKMFQEGKLGLRDFYFTEDDYRYGFNPEAKQRFINHLRTQFNKKPESEGAWSWDEVIRSKAAAFGRYLMKRGTYSAEKLDFTEPSPNLQMELLSNESR